MLEIMQEMLRHRVLTFTVGFAVTTIRLF